MNLVRALAALLRRLSCSHERVGADGLRLPMALVSSWRCPECGAKVGTGMKGRKV